MNNILQNIFSHDFKKIAIMESDGGVITYGELYENALGVANDLFEKNCSENVILYTGNTIEFAIGLLGIWLCGKVAVPVDIRTQPAHMKNILFNLKSNTIIYSEISPKESLLAKWCVFPRQKAVKKINLKNCINEIAFIFPTSGTTDVSKNVVLGISGIDEECKAIKMAHGFDLQTREIVIVPITSSCGCLGQLVPVLYSGGSIVLYKGSFNVPKLIRTIHTYNPNILVCTSSILSLLLNASALKMDDLKSIERIISAGEKSDINTLNILKERFNIQSVTQAYGLTETSSQLSGSSLDINAPLESVGKILRNFEVRIVEDGVEKDINEIGEIQVKGEAVMKGYYQYGKICRNSFDNGWFNTGDIGYIDSNGYLYIKGRIKNIIIVAGKNIYPEEVEDILMKNENILFAHVYAIPSKITNEKVVADICVRSGASISLKAVMEFCRKNMDKYMIPNEIHFVTQQSINFSGKLCRK